ncbi:MAG: DUF1002 domain-containing protein [Christensenellales bacterium]|jgi:uncharacterized protein YpuA (DUF1002 family)
MKKLFVFIFALILLTGGIGRSIALADGEGAAATETPEAASTSDPDETTRPMKSTVCLGYNLTEKQKEQVLKYMGLTMSEAEAIGIVYVHIEDEHALLDSYISADKIGSRSLSSVYIVMEEEGYGIRVDTHNINWVSPSMYTNALITAGIANAKVIVAAPLSVSGTAALAGVYKAYESASGVELSESAKDAASAELITTGELGELFGSEEAAALMAEIKAEVLEKSLTNPDEIRKAIRDIAAAQNISLTDEQVEQILEVIQKIAALDIDPQQFFQQIVRFKQNMDTLQQKNQEALSVVQKIVQFFIKLGDWLRNLFGKNN